MMHFLYHNIIVTIQIHLAMKKIKIVLKIARQNVRKKCR